MIIFQTLALTQEEEEEEWCKICQPPPPWTSSTTIILGLRMSYIINNNQVVQMFALNYPIPIPKDHKNLKHVWSAIVPWQFPTLIILFSKMLKCGFFFKEQTLVKENIKS
jgi:hypothetical protein